MRQEPRNKRGFLLTRKELDLRVLFSVLNYGRSEGLMLGHADFKGGCMAGVKEAKSLA